MKEDTLNAGWFRYPEYWPALYLALNHEAGGLEIHDAIYSEEYDRWFIELTDTDGEYNGGYYYDMAFQLEGFYVRSCFKAIKERGDISWVNTPLP